MHTTVLAQNLFQVGPHLGQQMIGLAKWILFGAAAILASLSFLARKHTEALKIVAVGLVLIGLVLNLPSLGKDSGDTVNSIRGSTR